MSSIGKIKESTRVVERALVGSISESVYQMAILKLPFLAWPFVKSITKFILDKTLYWLSEEGIILFNTVWIRVKVGQDAARLELARQRAIKAMDGTVMDKELDNIDEELRRAFDDLHKGSRNRL